MILSSFYIDFYNVFDDLDNQTLVEKIKALLEDMDIDIAWQAVLRLIK